MPITSFKFTPITKADGNIVEVPYIPVRLQYAHKINSIILNCLVDSGADISLFPAAWGQSVGINIKKGKEIPINGIGGAKVIAYGHKVKLHVYRRVFDALVYFSFEQQTPLLGREGFFDKYLSVNFIGNSVEIKY